MRRRSATNLGDSAGSVNGGQADGGGSGLLAAGSAKAGGSATATGGATDDGSASGVAKRDADATTSAGAAGQASAGVQAVKGQRIGTVASPAALAPGSRGTARPTARSRRPGSPRSRFALANWRVRWRLAAMIAVPTLTAAFLGALTIYGDVNTWVATGRVQHLAQLNASVVTLTQALEDERDLSAGYAANRQGGAALAGRLKTARAATAAAVQTVQSGAAGVTTGAGYQPTTVQYLNELLYSVGNLPSIRQAVSSSAARASLVIQTYTSNVLQEANTFSASVGNGADDASLQGNVIALGALLRMENELSVQRAILFAALSSPLDILAPADLASLQQAYDRQSADQADFDSFTSQAQQQALYNTLSGPKVNLARSQESIA